MYLIFGIDLYRLWSLRGSEFSLGTFLPRLLIAILSNVLM